MEPIYKICKFNFGDSNISDQIIFLIPTITRRKLRSDWTIELVQDVSAFHNIDAEAELTRLLTENLVTEINTEILNNYIPTRNIIPVQPLGPPNGQIFYLDYVYGDNLHYGTPGVKVYDDGSIGVNFKMKPHTII